MNLWSQALNEKGFSYKDPLEPRFSYKDPLEPPPVNHNLEKGQWHRGKKTHFVSIISTIIGIAAIAGYVPEMNASEGISMIQSAGYASTFRAALSSGVGGLIGGLISKFK